jgi:hypothetical protein
MNAKACIFVFRAGERGTGEGFGVCWRGCCCGSGLHLHLQLLVEEATACTQTHCLVVVNIVNKKPLFDAMGQEKDHMHVGCWLPACVCCAFPVKTVCGVRLIL